MTSKTKRISRPVFLLLLLSLIFIPQSFAQEAEFNPKSVDSITLRIVQSGTLTADGEIQRANLSLYIPQEGVQDLSVSSNSQMAWKYGSDAFGNRIVVLEWDRPSGAVNYQLDILVKNTAKFVNPTSDIGFDSRYLGVSKSIVITDDIRRLAYPYEKTWENVARLTELVYDLVDYDISVVGQRQSSQWTLENKRGVCVEHANLLTALLRASGIPTRYVVGYAYSTVDKKLIGHTWVEVLATDGRWVPFDPTWLEGGYLDATHIKTANLLDDNQTDVLTYVGSGKMTWQRRESASRTADLYSDTLEIIDYTLRNVTSISLSATDVPLGGYGYVKSTVSSNVCLINQITMNSCVDASNNPVFDVYEKERKFFSCSSKDVYWFFKESDGSKNYLCPAVVFDQIGSNEEIAVRAEDRINLQDVSISGPDVAAVNEKFGLHASAPGDFIFYSPEFGRSRDDDWTLSISRAGGYTFYLFSDGNLARKTVNVVERKEFDLSVAAPSKVKVGDNFTVNITMRNVEPSTKNPTLKIEFDGFSSQRFVTLSANKERYTSFNLTASSAGQKQLSVSLLGDTLTPYSSFITVEDTKKPGDFIGNLIRAILGLLSSIKDLVGGLLK